MAVYFSTQRNESSKAEAANAEATIILAEARTKAELQFKEAELKAKDLLVQARAQADNEIRERRRELAALETKIESREEVFERRVESFERREADFNRREQSLRSREKNLESKEGEHQALLDQARHEMEKVAGLTREEAKRSIIDEIVGQARNEAAKHIRLVEEEAREEADRRAKRILTVAIERMAGEFVAERTVAVVPLPSDEMKGRIIGREGRNIRAIEAATGGRYHHRRYSRSGSHFLPQSDSARNRAGRPGAAYLRWPYPSGADRGGRAQSRAGGRGVDPAKPASGRCLEVGVHGVHPELVKLLGMLKYRYSYAQNVLMHSIESGVSCAVRWRRSWALTKSRRAARRCSTISARR